MTPLLPYVQIGEWVLLDAHALGAGLPPAPLSIKPFGTLVAIGVYLGAILAVRQGRRLGFDEKTLVRFMMWIVAGGFLGGHVFDTLFYFPQRVLADPLSLLRLWEGLSSFGGFLGAFLGALAFRARFGGPTLPYMDVVASAFPTAWVFGRAGCSVAHDHPGVFSESWLAVPYPEGARFDLGILEMLWAVALALVFLRLRRRPRPWGFYLGTMCLSYAPFRFTLDFLRARDLRISDERYFDLTPAQWASVALAVVAVVVLRQALRSADQSARFAVPSPPVVPPA
ncbi:MAG: prolipoprotein diacylglyceryl transferase [Polyangiaceae bacterium]